ncbi:MAG: hypothetical protein ACYTG1_07585 [Planctomycetota bacterium]|jgi:hypothetical protein
MTDERFEQALADYLGGEMDGPAAARFEAALAGDPQRRAEVEALRRAQATLASLPGVEARTIPTRTIPAPAAPGPPVAARPRLPGPFLRYAAVFGLAFVVGYAVRGRPGAVTPGPGPDAAAVDAAPGAAPAPVPAGARDWRQRFAMTYQGGERRTDLGRALAALAATSADETEARP